MNLLKILTKKDILSKLFFTVATLTIFRAVAVVPIPGIPSEALKDILAGSSFFQVLGLLSGGLLESVGILTIGLGPYINASYIFQLLSVAIPQIREMYQGGPVERKTLTMYTRLLSVPLAVVQSIVIYTLLKQFGLLGETQDTLQIVSTVMLLTFGAVFSMWLGELVTEFGLGGGSSVIILAGILVSIPRNLESNFLSLTDDWKKVVLVMVIIGLVLLAVVISSSFNKIKLIYARRVRPSGNQGYANFLPLNINPAGVMPVIFAISLLDVPRIAFSYVTQNVQNESLQLFAAQVVNLYNYQFGYDMILMLVTVIFTFISAFIIFRPNEVAENVNKQGAYIEGVRPGKETEKYLRKVLVYTTIFGAILLGVITLAPSLIVLGLELPRLVVTGTGALIVASVILDVIRQVQALYAAKQDHVDYY
ncbi:MAG: preprotein translocase subunit SecY [Candidatus Dojkabacteria bacterium]|nr:MAG: preprotein translocase subunit SecY [Candidatus Dojkabacteria bacterium]